MSAAIETHQLTKSYGAARGIEMLDLRVEAAEVFGFLGPNGAGKSTTIRTLLDFQRPTSGTAEVFELDSRRDSVRIRAHVGYLPGELHLFLKIEPRVRARSIVRSFATVSKSRLGDRRYGVSAGSWRAGQDSNLRPED